MGAIWTDTYKLKTWLEVEIAVCEAQGELGYIPTEAVEEIKAKADFDPKRVLEIEAEVRHDVIAFLTNVNEYVGDAGRYIHLGLTSSDVLDTGLALQMVASLNLILEKLEELIHAIRYQAQQHRYTVMVGRSHGIHAEPITFGFKLAGWLAEVLRNRDRLVRLRKDIAVGKISGAVNGLVGFKGEHFGAHPPISPYDWGIDRQKGTIFHGSAQTAQGNHGLIEENIDGGAPHLNGKFPFGTVIDDFQRSR